MNGNNTQKTMVCRYMYYRGLRLRLYALKLDTGESLIQTVKDLMKVLQASSAR